VPKEPTGFRPPEVAVAPPEPVWRFEITGGVIGHNTAQTAGDETGGQALFGDLLPAFGATVHVNPGWLGWNLSTGFSFTPFGRNSASHAAEVRLLDFDLGAETPPLLGGKWRAHAGPGLLFTFLKGSGGTVSLTNGTTPHTFFMPSGLSTSVVFMGDVGLAGPLWNFQGMRLGVDAWALGLGGRGTVDLLLRLMYEI
jgi:hypothetical protein